MNRTRIRPQSAKRARQNRERRALRKQLLEERGPLCEVGIPNVCDGRWTDMHERLSRARGGSVTDAENILLVCRADHAWIHAHPEEAERHGWLQSSWDAA